MVAYILLELVIEMTYSFLSYMSLLVFIFQFVPTEYLPAE